VKQILKSHAMVKETQAAAAAPFVMFHVEG